MSPTQATAATFDGFDTPAFYDDLVRSGLLLPSGVPGVWGRGAVFEDVLTRFDALVMREPAAASAATMTFPPVLARSLIEELGYLDNFPQLAGSVHSFTGQEAKARELSARVSAGEPWADLLDPTAVMLTPAACYPFYPLFSGLLPEGGRLLTTLAWCFRHEPSAEPTRLQSFRVREFVQMGSPEAVEAWRDAWLARSLTLLQALGLDATPDVATDPFFGRAGRMMSTSQREQRLKFEIVVPVISKERPTALCSFNWHQEHFTGKFGIHRDGGAVAHTACLGFGMERVVLALFKTHGTRIDAWPTAVHDLLWP